MGCSTGTIEFTPYVAGELADAPAVAGVVESSVAAAGMATNAPLVAGDTMFTPYVAGGIIGSCVPSSATSPVALTAVADNVGGVVQHIVVTFDKPVTGSGFDGVTWTGLDTGPANTNPSSELEIQYIVDAGQTLYNDDSVNWAYDPANGGDLLADSGAPVLQSNLDVDMSGLDAPPVPGTDDAWATESDGTWLTETGDKWILETQP